MGLARLFVVVRKDFLVDPCVRDEENIVQSRTYKMPMPINHPFLFFSFFLRRPSKSFSDFPHGMPQQMQFIYYKSNRNHMRNEKETVLDMLINPRAGDNFDRKQSEKQLLQAITSKNQELNILHQVNTRLGYELSLLQKKLGIDPLVILKELQKIGEMSLHYHADLGQLQYLDHLLLSYDETILKQKKIIAMLYSQLQDFQKKSQTIVRENEYLLQQNKNKCKKILEIFHRGYPQENLTLSYNKLLRETEQERNDIVKEESEEVLVAYNQLQLHCENLERDLEDSNRAAEKYFESLKRQSEELKESLLSVDNLLKVKEFLEKTVNKLGEENIALETMKNQNESRISKLQSQLKSIRNQLFTQKKINRDDNERIAFELDSLKSQSQNAGKRERETFNRNMILEKQLQTAKETLRGLKRESEKVKGELQQTLKMCETYESKITSQTRKEQSLVDILDKSKEKLDSIILERDKALLKLQRLEKIIEDMNSKHREDQLKLRQTYERMLVDQQEKLKIVTDQKEETESIFLQSQLTLKNQLQKLTRENSLLREENLKFIENIHVNTGSEIINKLKEYQAKNDSLLKLINQKEKQLKDQQNKSQESTHQYEGQIKNLNRLLEKEKNAATQYMKEITQERSKTNILNNQKECLENEVKKLKKNYEYKNVQMNDDREFRIHQLQSRLNQSVKKEKEVKARALEMLERYDETELRLKTHYEKIIGELEAENLKLKKKIEKAKARRNE